MLLLMEEEARFHHLESTSWQCNIELIELGPQPSRYDCILCHFLALLLILALDRVQTDIYVHIQSEQLTNRRMLVDDDKEERKDRKIGYSKNNHPLLFSHRLSGP